MNSGYSCIFTLFFNFHVTSDCYNVPKIAQNEFSGENLIRRNKLVGLISSWKGLGRVWHYVTSSGCEND